MFSLVAEAIIVSCLQTNLQPGSLLHTADYISSSVFLFHRNFAGGYGGYPNIYIHLSTQQLVSRVPIMHLLLHKFGVGCHTSPTKIIQTSLSVTQRIPFFSGKKLELSALPFRCTISREPFGHGIRIWIPPLQVYAFVRLKFIG